MNEMCFLIGFSVDREGLMTCTSSGNSDEAND
jgi:hypothetical protein